VLDKPGPAVDELKPVGADFVILSFETLEGIGCGELGLESIKLLLQTPRGTPYHGRLLQQLTNNT
jgi:hypothetical protein